MDTPNVTLNEIERYLELTGKRGASIMSMLGKLNPYFQAIISSEIGYQLIKDDVDRMEVLLMKIYKSEESFQEKAEFAYLRDKRMPKILDNITKYLEGLGQIKKVVNQV